MIDRVKKFFDGNTPKKILAPIKLVTGLFAHNFLPKIISLVAAFFTWFIVMEAQDPTIEGSYEVAVTTSNASHEFLVSCQEKTVTLNTLAPRSYFVKYDANAFRAYANLEGLGEGTYELAPQIVMPQGFEQVGIDPPKVHVMIDSLSEKQFPFDLITKGNVSPDTAIKSLTKSMDIITIMGPKSLVNRVARVYGTLPFAGNTESFEAQIPMKAVDANDELLIGVRVVPSVVTVNVELESGVAKKIVPVVAELTAAEGWEVTKVTVDPAQVEITGAESVINSIVTIKTDPITVQTGQRSFRNKIRLNVPDAVTAKETEVTVSAEVVRRSIVREPSTTDTSTTTPATDDTSTDDTN